MANGTGALPLLRHIILNDDKSSTYKLALLRALCRIADGAAGYARDADDDHVAVPLGLVALYWIRLFKPLLAAGLPQSPGNRGDAWLGFVKEAFRQLAAVSHHDLRIGMRFVGEGGQALHQALKDTAETVTRMPATYMTFPNGGAVLPVRRIGRVPVPQDVVLDDAYLASFGEMLIPRHLWRALQRFDAWIEPALVSEWTRLMKAYALRQGRSVDDGQLATAMAMAWSEPTRDVRLAREQAIRLIAQAPLHCVWSGIWRDNLDEVVYCLTVECSRTRRPLPHHMIPMTLIGIRSPLARLPVGLALCESASNTSMPINNVRDFHGRTELH